MSRDNKTLASSHPIFTSNKWGNSNNSGKAYKRPYCKTRMTGIEYQRSIK